ncbi:MAG: FtsW/RodA/SpoVE family cell cycle protein [Bacteroidaceae bacterium]|nr:FtsW/RodA/SpoVE family cell cycle protein [Bacteroidaceae bacterium]
MTSIMKTHRIFQGDKAIWVIFFFLCIISLIEVFSSASTLAYKSGSFWQPLFKQALFLGMGTLVVIALHNIPCRKYKLIPFFFLPAAFLLLAITLFLGEATNGASRWLTVFGIPFQPSEIAKGAVVTSVALILAVLQRENGADRAAFKYIMWITMVICGLIVTENLSTAALLFGVVFLMMFLGRVPFSQLGKLLGVLILLGASLILLIKILPEDTNSKVYDLPGLHRLSTWKNRLSTHGDRDKYISPQEYDIDKNAQIAHANIAIASSRGFGKMPGNSVERDFLSQAFSDFIFAIIIEEMGLAGAAIVLMLYIVLLFRAGRIASRCERNFPAFLIMGLALLFVSQAMINMMVAVGLFPVTGQPLPLISRGGTSTLINCAYIGMMLSVSRYAKQSEEEAKRQAALAQLESEPENTIPEEEYRSSEGLV